MISLRAPAKLNLYLRVLGRRADGYHELETLFERIDLADELTFTPQARGIRVRCDDPTLDCGVSNLVTKAATLLQQTCHVACGVAITITKRIPIAGGLGGGSSDAATTLLGLNQLWELGLSSERLGGLAAQLGSDVPFFLEPQVFAVGRGRGERCEPLTGDLPTLWHVLLIPDARLSTQAVYEGFDAAPSQESHLTPSDSLLTMCLHALRNGSLRELAKGMWNDLEPEAIRRCPVIHALHSSLRNAGCLGTLMSGSGPTVFGLCQDADHAEQTAQRVRTCLPRRARRRQASGSPAWEVRVVRTADDMCLAIPSRGLKTRRAADSHADGR